MSTDFDLTSAADHDLPPEASSASTRQRSAKMLTVIEPVRGWQPINFRELWSFRELLFFLSWRDVKVRYKQTVLGLAWAILQPAMLMIVFTVFVGRMAQMGDSDIPYPLYVYLGLLPWSFFSNAIGHAGSSVVQSERLVTKVYFPRLAIPIASVGASIIDFLIAFCLLIVLMVYYHVSPGGNIWLVPIVFLVIVLFSLGVGTILGAMNVLYRDFRYLIPFMVQIWMFATPTIYNPQASVGGSRWYAILLLNPMSGLVTAFRNACLGDPVNLTKLAVLAASGAGLFLCGCWYFRRLESRFADVI